MTTNHQYIPTRTVSVIIPAYNIAPWLARAIESALAQTAPPHEIIIIDDGSTDETPAVAARYADRVRIIRQENAGLAAARNAGIQAATGQWIALLDGDDYWLPQRLELQHRVLDHNPDLVWCSCNFSYLDARHDRQRPFKSPDQLRPHLDPGSALPHYIHAVNELGDLPPVTMLLHRRVFDELGLFDPAITYAEDLDMWWRVVYRWPRIGFVPEPSAVYLVARPDSLTAGTEPARVVANIATIYARHRQPAADSGNLPPVELFLRTKLRRWLLLACRTGRLAPIRPHLPAIAPLFPRRFIRLAKTLTFLPARLQRAACRLLRKSAPPPAPQTAHTVRPGTLLRRRALAPLFRQIIPSDALVLDLGGFDGTNAAHLAATNPSLRLLVADIDPVGLAHARDRGLDAVLASATCLPLPDASVDVCLCLDLIEHVPEDRAALAEISRVLRPGGVLILTTPMQNGITFPFLDRPTNLRHNREDLQHHLRWGYSREHLLQLLAENSLTLTTYRTFFNFLSRWTYYLMTFCPWRFPGRRRLFSALFFLAMRLEPRFEFAAQEHVIVATRTPAEPRP